MAPDLSAHAPARTRPAGAFVRLGGSGPKNPGLYCHVFLQFVQQPGPRLEIDRLRQHAARHFAAELCTLNRDADARRATLALRHTTHGECTFRLHARLATPGDRSRLPAAELRNQSHGMAALGERCQCVWEVEADPVVPLSACFYFGALLASVALGPLLPDDDSGLFGVRSARLRAEALVASHD